MKDGKQIVWRYDGDAKSDDVQQDLEGEIAVPEKDSVIMRKGRRWKAVQINEQRELTANSVPIYRVFLASKF